MSTAWWGHQTNSGPTCSCVLTTCCYCAQWTCRATDTRTRWCVYGWNHNTDLGGWWQRAHGTCVSCAFCREVWVRKFQRYAGGGGFGLSAQKFDQIVTSKGRIGWCSTHSVVVGVGTRFAHLKVSYGENTKLSQHYFQVCFHLWFPSKRSIICSKRWGKEPIGRRNARHARACACRAQNVRRETVVQAVLLYVVLAGSHSSTCPAIAVETSLLQLFLYVLPVFQITTVELEHIFLSYLYIFEALRGDKPDNT